jgi:phospholipid/cholesterol/gamma-HCH transport system substrate-binding protein
MRPNRTLEFTTGIFLLLGIAALFYLATEATNYKSAGGAGTYTVRACFGNVGGLHAGAPVRIGGVTVGRVTAIDYSFRRYEACTHLAISKRDDRIPSDSTASILTQGVLGEQYVGLSPGGAPTYLHQGSTIHFTQSAVILEKLIGKFLANQPTKKGGS